MRACIPELADWKSAKRQTGSLRYELRFGRAGRFAVPELMARLEPVRFLVAQTVGCEHEEVGFGGLIQVEICRTVGFDDADVPTLCIHAVNFRRRLVGSRFGGVTAAVRSTAQGQELTIGRPVHMVDLVVLVLDVHAPFANRRLLRLEIDGRAGQIVVLGSPGHHFAVRAEAGTAAGNLQVDDLVSMGLDEHNRMIKSHASVNG